MTFKLDSTRQLADFFSVHTRTINRRKTGRIPPEAVIEIAPRSYRYNRAAVIRALER